MHKNILYFLLIVSLLSTGCKSKSWVIISATGQAIPIDQSTDSIADTAYMNYLKPIKKELDRKMNVVIGHAAETMKGHAPESLLSNFSADVYRQAATQYLDSTVDIAIVNLGGLRTTVPAGDITIGKIFELMPFENELVILWLKGDKLYDLMQFFASIGGEGETGIRMTIRDKKAVDITINGEPLDKNKVYTIATNDYLAGGNDKMVQLATYQKRVDTGIKIRDMLIDYIKNETANGREINSELDGRIQ
ncbi:MAG: 5'-nucleotidase C-terminal domain-containing protein [Paludibacter sp.]|nr:5'-nucleotidase C-terminal domain-containing protein [Paludibacter sp.]